MIMRFPIFLGLLVILAQPQQLLGQSLSSRSSDNLWEFRSPSSALLETPAFASADRSTTQGNIRQVQMDASVLKAILAATPKEAARTAEPNPIESVMTLPMPDGSFEKFRIEETSVMAPSLAARFPSIQTFRGQGLDDKTAQARLDLTANGFRVWVRTADDETVIDPMDRERPELEDMFTVASKRDLETRTGEPFQCLVREGSTVALARDDPQFRARGGQGLRMYRLAVAATGEYSGEAGGTKISALSRIVTTVNRVTGIYESELGVRLQLVANTDDLIFLDKDTDPFTNNNANALIGESQSVIDDQIGDANYDIGHTFSTGAGGLAGLGVVTVSGRKAQGVTGRTNPFGDPFDVDYVAHEIGHQFGGDHTFNGRRGSCTGGNRNGPTAVEPGSGSTIQAYAGICGQDNLQPNSDPYFHSVSLDQMLHFVNQGAASSVTPIPTGNNVPTVDAGQDFTIPARTPFTLTASGSDPDVTDSLTYSWEQRDLGPTTFLETPLPGEGPLFRSLRPMESASRTFPMWEHILSGGSSLGEALPTTDRTMRFRATVRDNRSGGGGINSDEMDLRVHGGAGPFQVMEPNANDVRSGFLLVRWNVAETDQPPISTDFVNILLSDNGGTSFNTVLTLNTPNDGEELVALPNVVGSQMRIKVESVGNIFFAVSPSDFAIEPFAIAVIAVRHAEKGIGVDPPLLIPEGIDRAESLRTLLASSQLSRVFSTDTRRTQATATPTAEAFQQTIELYDSAEQLAEELIADASGQRVLVVGHSDTTPELLRKLGAPTVSIEDHEFDRVFLTTVLQSGAPPVFQEFHYATSSDGEKSDLKVMKTGDSDTVVVGKPLTYTVTVTNLGPDPATEVTVTDTLPSSFTFSSASSECGLADGKVTCTIGALAVDENQVVTISGQAPLQPEIMANTANVTGNQTDPNIDNNSASISTTVKNGLPLGDKFCQSPGLDISTEANIEITDVLTIDQEGELESLRVSLDITHSYVGDLVVTLEHEAVGPSVVLFQRPIFTQGNCSFNDVKVTLNDEAPKAVQETCDSTEPAIKGTLKSKEPLSGFHGKELSGSWKLTVEDDVFMDGGRLNEWCLITGSDE